MSHMIPESVVNLERIGISRAGTAVEIAIISRQRSELFTRHTEPSPRVNCASGTAYSDGESISQAVRDQQRRALLACPAQIRRRRTNIQWKMLYEEAIAKKRERLAIVANMQDSRETVS